MKITTKLLATCAALGLLAIATVAQAVSTPATMPFSEGFELSSGNFATSGWQSILVADTNPQPSDYFPAWSLTNNPAHPSVTPSGYSASFNSYYNSDRSKARLEYGRLFNFTGYDSLTMSFAMSHDSGYPVDNDRVQWQYKTLTGVWTNIGGEKSRYQVDASAGRWDTETIVFNDVLGLSNVKIGLLGISEYGNNIYIDNISLTGKSPAAVPEASTLIGFGSALAMAGPGLIGWLRRRKA